MNQRVFADTPGRLAVLQDGITPQYNSERVQSALDIASANMALITSAQTLSAAAIATGVLLGAPVAVGIGVVGSLTAMAVSKALVGHCSPLPGMAGISKALMQGLAEQGGAGASDGAIVAALLESGMTHEQVKEVMAGSEKVEAEELPAVMRFLSVVPEGAWVASPGEVVGAYRTDKLTRESGYAQIQEATPVPFSRGDRAAAALALSPELKGRRDLLAARGATLPERTRGTGFGGEGPPQAPAPAIAPATPQAIAPAPAPAPAPEPTRLSARHLGRELKTSHGKVLDLALPGYLLAIGGPGSGKSTIGRQVALLWAVIHSVGAAGAAVMVVRDASGLELALAALESSGRGPLVVVVDPVSACGVHPTVKKSDWEGILAGFYSRLRAGGYPNSKVILIASQALAADFPGSKGQFEAIMAGAQKVLTQSRSSFDAFMRPAVMPEAPLVASPGTKSTPSPLGWPDWLPMPVLEGLAIEAGVDFESQATAVPDGFGEDVWAAPDDQVI